MWELWRTVKQLQCNAYIIGTLLHGNGSSYEGGTAQMGGLQYRWTGERVGCGARSVRADVSVSSDSVALCIVIYILFEY